MFDKTTGLFLMPQTLDFTGSLQKVRNETDIFLTSYSTETKVEYRFEQGQV